MSPVRASSYAGKATEFLAVARHALAEGSYVAATSLAIHAGVNAADAVCVARLGERAAGQAHDEVRALLKGAGRDGADVAKHLSRLLPLETKAEYDADDIPRTTAQNAVRWASRAVETAERVVAEDVKRQR